MINISDKSGITKYGCQAAKQAHQLSSETNHNSDPQHTLVDNLNKAMSKFWIVEIALTMRHTVPGEAGKCSTEVL